MSKPVVYIERHDTEPMWEHCLAAWQGFKWDGYEVKFFSPLGKPSGRGPHDGSVYSYSISPNIPVVGSVESTQHFLLAAFGKVPAPLNVPDELLPFAGRIIERTTISAAFSGDFPVFIKPADTCKLFTGGVVTNPVTARLCFDNLPDDTAVLASPEIKIESEFRIFVNRKREIVAMKHYAGDPFAIPTHYRIRHMIDAYKSAPCCYSLDVAVVGASEAETIVVECNDMWSLGTYGMDPVAYSRMLAQRWHEMITHLTK